MTARDATWRSRIYLRWRLWWPAGAWLPRLAKQEGRYCARTDCMGQIGRDWWEWE